SMIGQPLPLPPAGGYGPWTRGAALLRFAEAFRAGTVTSAANEAWTVLHLGGGTDFQPLARAHHLPPRSPDARLALRAAARALLQAPDVPHAKPHPLHAHLRLIAETKRYDGAGHVVAARELGEQGRAREALALLADAAVCAGPLGAPMLGDI